MKSASIYHDFWVKKLGIFIYGSRYSRMDQVRQPCGKQPLKQLRQTISLKSFERLSYKNFTWSIPEYLDPYKQHTVNMVYIIYKDNLLEPTI